MKWERARKVISWERRGIRRRLLLWGLTLLGLALIINTLAGVSYTRIQIQRGVVELHAEVASRVAREIEQFIGLKIERLLDVAILTGLHKFAREEQKLHVSLLLKNDSSFTEIAILDGRGMEVLKISEGKTAPISGLSDHSRKEKFKKAFGGKSYVSPVYTSVTAEPYITVAVPIRAESAQIVGVVSAEVNLKFLWQVIGDIKFRDAGYAYLVDGKGNLIAHRDPSLVLKRKNLKHIHEVKEFIHDPTGIDPTPAEEGEGIMGKPVLGTFASLPRLGIAIVLEEPVEAASAELRRAEHYAFLLLGLGLLFGAVIIIYVSGTITKPIRELHRGVEVIGSGDLDHRVEIKSGDEIEDLAQEFNEMAGELKTLYLTLEQKVEQRTNELTALYDVTTTINQSLELELILKEATEKLLEVLRFDGTRIFLLDGESKELKLKYSKGTNGEHAQVCSYRIGEGITGKVAQSGEMMTFQDIQVDSRYRQLASKTIAAEAAFRACVCLPLKNKERVVGAVNLFSYSAHDFTAEEIRMLTSMANQIGLSVERANLFDEIVQKSKELEQLNRELEEANRTKADFVAAMSHELRTPLNVIIGNADLLREGIFGDISEKQGETLEKIVYYSRMLLKLINDVLTVSKMEASKLPLRVSTFAADEIVSHAQSFVEHMNRNGHVKILWKVQPNLPPLTTDALKLEEILQNLIGNAFKFTPEGTIEIRVGDLVGKDRIEFAVADTGMGIEKSDLDRIFERFYQHKECHTGNYSGVGLGLNIVKSYLDIMSGEIRVESHPGRGSTFTFTFPYSV
jgi:signal transduction histidine kinase